MSIHGDSTPEEIRDALYSAPDPPTHYALSESDIRQIATYFDWESRWVEAPGHETLADMIRSNPAPFLSDISTFYEGDGDDRYYPKV